MNTQSDRKNSNYLVMLLLVVGLTAFSHSMKKLYEFHQMAVDASRMIAQWSSSEVPVEVAPAQVKVEVCENRTPVPPMEELAELAVAPEPIKVKKIERKARAESFDASLETLIARAKKAKRLETADPLSFHLEIATDQNEDEDESTVPQVPVNWFKGKNRKHDNIRINAREREMLLKTLNRGISVRIAG